MKTKLKLTKACSVRGADMGRPNFLPLDTSMDIKLNLVRLKWVDQDYDQNGAYWGRTKNDFIYCAWTVPMVEWKKIDGTNDPKEYRALPLVQIFARARNRQEAKVTVRELLPNARFFN